MANCHKETPHSFTGAWQALPADLFGEAQGMAAHWSVVGTGGAVSSANALATEAGIEILKRGGNAIDALLAVLKDVGVGVDDAAKLNAQVGFTMPQRRPGGGPVVVRTPAPG